MEHYPIYFSFGVWWAEATLGFGDEQQDPSIGWVGPVLTWKHGSRWWFLDRWMKVLMIQQNSLNSKGGKREKISKASEFAVLHILAWKFGPTETKILKQENRTLWQPAQVWHLQQGILKDEEDNRASNSGHAALQGNQQFKPHEPAGFFDSVRSGRGQLSTWRVQWFVIFLSIYLVSTMVVPFVFV